MRLDLDLVLLTWVFQLIGLGTWVNTKLDVINCDVFRIRIGALTACYGICELSKTSELKRAVLTQEAQAVV